jgi:hypothetical protein
MIPLTTKKNPNCAESRLDKIFHKLFGIGLVYGVLITGYDGILIGVGNIATPHTITVQKHTAKEFSIPIITKLTGYSDIDFKGTDYLGTTVPYVHTAKS